MQCCRRARPRFCWFPVPAGGDLVAVRWYLRYRPTGIEELLAERGVTVDHVTIYLWVQRFTPEFIEAARPCRHAPGDRWFVNETYLKVAGQWTHLYRAASQVIDALLSVRRDLAAARRFLTRTRARARNAAAAVPPAMSCGLPLAAGAAVLAVMLRDLPG